MVNESHVFVPAEIASFQVSFSADTQIKFPGSEVMESYHLDLTTMWFKKEKLVLPYLTSCPGWVHAVFIY